MRERLSITIHPLFIALGIFYLVMGSGYVFLCYFVAVLLHEMAHSRMARLRGYRLGQIVLMPYGAVLKGGENFPKVDSVLIAIAGPVANLVIALFIIALWWLIPSLYVYTEHLMWANLSLALFNLLPIFPLDGARLVLALSTRRARMLYILRVCGIVMSVVLLLLMIISLFYTFNISLGVMAIFLMHGAVSGTDRELYSHIMTMDNFHKSTVDVLLFLDIGISIHAELYRYLEAIRRDRVVTFHILDDDFRTVRVMSEEEVRDMILTHDLSTSYADVVDEDNVSYDSA